MTFEVKSVFSSQLMQDIGDGYPIAIGLYFLRDVQGHEIDAIIETAPRQLIAVEIKAGQAIATD
jgi:hypothetical protein